jgi:DNA-directed RNA polymerase subunit alpha
MLITDEHITFDAPQAVENEMVDEHILHMRKLLKTPLERFSICQYVLSTASKQLKINSLEELVSFNTNDLLKFRNFGKKSLVRIRSTAA